MIDTDYTLDERLPEVRVEFGMARAEYAFRSATRALADQYAAIHATLLEARQYPATFVGEVFARDADAGEFAVRSAVADLAVRLSLSEQTIRAQDELVATMLRCTPRAWALFREGDVSAANARTIADLASTLPADSCRAFEDAILPSVGLAPARFKARARAMREKVQPEQAAERHRRAAEDRRAWLDRDIDGMSWFGIYLPATDGERAFAHVDKAARHLAQQSDETRTLEQLRADVAADLLAGVLGSGAATGVSVGVTVPVMTLLGLADEPATLDGYGPIDADTARRLAAHAPSFYRILTHPVSSAILDLDRTTYRVPTDLARMVGLRDRQCAFIGCGRQARDCDIDHTIAWQHGGATALTNLKVLCRDHHRVKHNSGWNLTQDATGRTTWTSPTGLVRDADPPPF